MLYKLPSPLVLLMTKEATLSTIWIKHICTNSRYLSFLTQFLWWMRGCVIKRHLGYFSWSCHVDSSDICLAGHSDARHSAGWLRGSGGTSKFIFTNGISFNYNPHRFALQFQLIKATLYRLSLAWRSAGLEKSHHWDKRRWNISYPVSALSGKIGLTLSHNLQLDRRQYWDFWEIHTGYLCTNNKDCTVETQADTTHEISRGSRGYGNYPKSTRAPNAFP